MDLNTDDALRASIVSRLPATVRWTVAGSDLEWNFSAAREGLRPPSRASLNCEPEPSWTELLIFGEYDYAAGGGASPLLGVRATDGAVYGLDLEREGGELFALNSSVEQFIETFLFLNGHLGSGAALRLDAEEKLRTIDPKAFPASEWRALLEAV